MSAREAAALRVGGLVPFSTVDWPGRIAAVVFVQGCPWRCAYCHNPHLQPRGNAAGPPWTDVLAWLGRRRGLLDGVVFSGGEPTADPALPAAIEQVRCLGFSVGLHSAGVYPRRLDALLPRVDWLALDVKAPLGDAVVHDRIAGVPGGARAVRASLAAAVRGMHAHGLELECRTTVHPALLDDAALEAMATELAQAGAPGWVLQVCRTQGVATGLAVPPAGGPSPALLAALRARLPSLAVRGA